MIEVYLKDTKLEILNTADLPSGKKFKSRFIQPGLAGYPQQYGNVLITKESLDKFVNTLEGKPVIINHQEVTTKNVADIEVGRVHNVWFNEEDGWYWCDGVLTSQNAIDLINDGYSVSCSYNVSDFTDKGGTVNNIKYDMEFLDGVFTHLAIVNNPRYEDAEITVINSKGDDMQADNDRWITVHPGGDEDAKGVHVKVKEGETNKEACERKFGEDKKEDKKGKVAKDENKTKEYKKQLHDKYKSLKTPEEKKAYLDYVNKETEKYSEDVNYKEAAEWLKEVDKSDVFGKDTSEGGEKKATEENKIISGKSKKIQSIVKEVKDKTGIDLGNYIGYAEDKGWSKKNQLYIDYDKLEKDWHRKDNGVPYRDALYWLGLRTDKEYNGGMGSFVKPQADNSLTNTIAEALVEVIAENCGE